MKKATSNEADICYSKSLARTLALVGFAWDNKKRLVEDFDLDSLGEMMACGTDTTGLAGWAVYSKFEGRVGRVVKLKRNW